MLIRKAFHKGFTLLIKPTHSIVKRSIVKRSIVKRSIVKRLMIGDAR